MPIPASNTASKHKTPHFATKTGTFMSARGV
jgi:hypothetical protein